MSGVPASSFQDFSSCTMDVFGLFYIIIFSVSCLHGFPTTERETPTAEIKADEYRPDYSSEGRGRHPRRIIRKIHSGLAFLAGVKVGALLANKGFEPGHGSLAATNSFQLFGKNINSAISFSYGGIGQKLPLLADVPVNDTTQKSSLTKEEDILHVTVVRNPSSDTVDKLKRIANVSVADSNHTLNAFLAGDSIVIESDEGALPCNLPAAEDDNFRRKHNKLVEEFNKETRRRNSKF